MIYGAWIIHKHGKCLLFREYETLNINDQLFSGFLVALLSFSKEISGRELKHISLEDLTLYYKTNEDKMIIFVIAGDSKEREVNIREKINSIEEEFLLEFGEILPTWKGDITVFNKFHTKIDEIVNSKGRRVSLLDFNFINKASFEPFYKKFTKFLWKKDKKEIDELKNTVGIIDAISERKEIFRAPSFILETQKKMSKAIKRLIDKIYSKKD
ncbi:MAG: hypothetical protein HWN65_02050 [Candidatus Helarchaeota archaeon]|nr:hypothetical protein [Candidatus Helarchaeota archaeon]